MNKDWPLKSVEEISERVAMGPFGSSIKVSTFVEQGIPVISGQHLKEGRLIDGENNFITEEHAHKLEKANVFPGDVIFTHAGNIGQVAYIPDSARYKRYVISQRQFYCRPDLNQVLPQWITAYFRSPDGRHSLLSNASSTGVPSIARPVTHLRSIKIPVPPLAEQEAIASILEVLEDKIQLNRRVARTLEELAQRLFKSWFVDFEPVRAKMAGRQPAHMPPETAALFPDKLVDSVLGLIPEGWKIAELREVIDVNPRETLKKDTESLYVEMAALPTSGMSIEGAYVRSFKSGTKFRKGDTLMARITPCLENGKAALFLHDHGDLPTWGSTEFIVFRPKESVPKLFPYLLIREPGFREYAVQNMTGTSGRQRVSAQSIAAYEMSVPPASVLNAFGDMVDGFGSRIEQLRLESQRLSELRDRLLPKLISGEIQVPETVD